MKYFVIISLKKIVLLLLNSSSMYILQNNSNIDYLWHNVFNKLNRTFILTGCHEYL